jgi:hypothetical protein
MINATTIRKSLAAPLMAFALIFTAAGAANVATIAPAEAAKVKIVKKGGKMVLRGIGRLGGKMSRSKIKVFRNAGKGMQNASKKGTKGIDRVSKGINKTVRKTKLGRSLDNTRRNAGRWKTKQLDKAFRNNRGKAGRFAKNLINGVTPF